MRWIKKGIIFKPKDHELYNGLNDFAQSPQALVLKDRVRIYFSIREKDGEKYLSHIQYVDFDKKLENILGISKHEVIKLGELGCFDEHGIFPMNVVKHYDNVIAFTGGWSRRKSVSIETSIGLAISKNNGETFSKHCNGPILTSSLNEPCLVGDPFVLPQSTKKNPWDMFYIYGLRWIDDGKGNKERVYKIGYAVGFSLHYWFRSQRQMVEDKLGPNECQAMPTVIRYQNKYHMYFCYREPLDFRINPKCGYKLGYAYTTNPNSKTNWTRDDSLAGIDVSKDGWDSDMMCYPHLFECDGNIYMLYNGNKFGKEGFGLAVLEK